MKKAFWAVVGLGVSMPLWKIYQRVFRKPAYVVIAGHDRHEKGEILSHATRKQLEEGLVVSVRPGQRLPRQAQVNPQLADAADDLEYQSPESGPDLQI